jgi:hypothetical protein
MKIQQQNQQTLEPSSDLSKIWQVLHSKMLSICDIKKSKQKPIAEWSEGRKIHLVLLMASSLQTVWGVDRF